MADIQCETTETHWDCECTDHYIIPKSVGQCHKCGARAEDQPDSRIQEVNLMADIRIGALPEVCDACLAQSVDHIPTDNDPGFEEAVRFCVGMGATMEGHRCERQESDGEIWCNCQCNSDMAQDRCPVCDDTPEWCSRTASK